MKHDAEIKQGSVGKQGAIEKQTKFHMKIRPRSKSIPDTAMVFSNEYVLSYPEPMNAGQLVLSVSEFIQYIADLAAVDGVILGHIKAVIMTDEDIFCGLSCTRKGDVDITYSISWDEKQSYNGWKLRLAILSMKHFPFKDENVREYFKLK